MHLPRNLYLGILVALLGLMVVLWVQRRSSQEVLSPLPEPAAQVQRKTGAPPGRNRVAGGQKDMVQTQAMGIAQQQQANAALLAAIEGRNVPIDFWGMVVDETNAPLSGVTVRAHIRRWQLAGNAEPLGVFPKINALTDTDGRFAFHGISGDVLAMEAIEKEGYEAEPGALRGFGYNTADNVTVSAAKPILFRMWRKETKEILVTGRKFFTIVPNGTNHIINLLRGSIDGADGEGDLSVWIKRPAGVRFGQRYPWSFEIKVINGGMAEEPDRYASMFLAPAAGYTNAYRGAVSESEQGWGDGLAGRRFYIAARNGRVYGRLEIEVYASYGNTGSGRLWLNYVLNPSGSRILR